MQIGAPELRRRFVDAVAKERVREAIRARDARKDMRERRRNELRRPVRSSFDDEVAMREQRERRRRRRGVGCKRLDSGVPELPAHHRAPLGDGALLGGEALDPSLEHRLEPRGQLLRVSPFRHVTRELEEHQRVPFRIAHEPPAVRADNVAGQLLEHELRRRRVEGLERDAHVLARVGEVGPGVEHVGSRRREHGDSRHARQGDEEVEHRRLRPVDVLGDEQNLCRPAEVTHDHERGLLDLCRRRRRVALFGCEVEPFRAPRTRGALDRRPHRARRATRRGGGM